MVWTVFRINVLRLMHNRIELLMTFVVPIAFFSIFAVIFGGIGSGATPKIKVVAVDQVESDTTRSVLRSLHESSGLRFMDDQGDTTLSVEEARELVRRGQVTLGIVLREDANGIRVELLADASDQVAPQVAASLVGQSLIRAAIARPGEAHQSHANTGPPNAGNPKAGNPKAGNPNAGPPNVGNPNAGNPKAGVQRLAAGRREELLSRHSAKPVLIPSETESDIATKVADEPAVHITDVMGEGKSNPVVSMYAAGIAVMFLLFGATGGGGALLEERENRTLERLLSTQLTMDHLLLGKWFYMTALGALQVGVMFLWGQIVFGVDLIGHLDGFVMMTVVTASAASAFGLFLATICRTRGQLNGLSVILVLTMSALGGSMVPRYVMSEQLRQYGLWTFNAWALDGYDKVFWRELPVGSLSPQLAVLLTSGMAFLLIARLLAVRWETD